MQRITPGSVSLTTWALLSVTALACDVAEPGDEELARDVVEEDEEDDEDVDGAGAIPGPDELTAPSDPAAAANYFVPVGTHDTATCSVIAGWVRDADTTAATWVSLRTSPYPYGQEIGSPVLADLYRSDLPFTDKNHGFSIATPSELQDGEDHTIYIHGINVDVNGDWDVNANSPLLDQTGKTICCGAGCYDPPDPPDGP